MDLEQKIEISLKEYMELKELEEHFKEVRIDETIYYNSETKEYNRQGVNITWQSDGKCWLYLADKLSNQGILVKGLIKEKKRLQRLISKLTIFNIKKTKLLSKDKGVENV